MKLVFKNYCWTVILLLLSFFISRAALSFISVLMILLLLKKNLDKKIIKQFITASIFIIIPVAVSGFWSSDVKEWWQLFSNKLLLITVGVAIVSLQLSFKQIKIIIWTLTVLTLLASGWSVWQYINNKQLIEQSYLVAKVIPVWLDDDHIRFSWLIVLTIILMCWQLNLQSSNSKEKIPGYISVLLLFAFLHFMAARTGLLCLYVALIIFFFYFLWKQKTRKYAAFFFIITIAIITLAFYVLPTLKNRMQYVVWDVKQFTNNNYLQGSADGGRWLSIKAGFDVGLMKPIQGVGFGDIRNEAIKWYDVHYPKTLPNERFIPHSEWIVYFAGSGMVGVIAFTVGLCLLYHYFFRKNIFCFVTAFVLIIPLITDDSLEGQYGITIFSFVIAMVYHLNKTIYTSAVAASSTLHT
ncbi:MAG: O-antigen ligase family protein [Bacteroidetes bacterium]|nr:O-antigen ligase family protein [Bacteroidota bacterium]MBS1648469.1 O-antigen ligase family protein [Bacteroidota bacterium]